jgi:DNA polymerase-1
VPFVGDSGKLSDKALIAAGLDLSKDVAFLNAARCRIPKDKKQKTKFVNDILRCCRFPLEYALKKIEPKVILLYGDIALRQVLRKQGITKHCIEDFYSKEFDAQVFPCFHPAYILRYRNHTELFESSIASAVAFYKGQTSKDKFTWVEFGYEKMLVECPTHVGIDTETHGLDWLNPDSIVISFSISPPADYGPGYQIWLYEKCASGGFMCGKTRVRKVKDYVKKVEFLRAFLANPNIKKYMMNGNYDVLRFEQLGIPRETIKGYTIDIGTAAHTLNTEAYKNADLGTIVRAFTGKASHKGKVDPAKLIEYPPKVIAEYAVKDSDSTREAAEVIKKRLLKIPALGNYYTKFVHPISSIVLFEITRNGLAFDSEEYPKIRSKVIALCNTYHNNTLKCIPAKVKHKYKDNLSLTRRDILRDALYDEDIGMGLPVVTGGKNKTATPSVDKKTLVHLLDRKIKKKARNLITAYQEYTSMYTLYSRYMVNLPELVRSDGRLHSSISFTFTVTGRTGMRAPSQQNWPKRKKEQRELFRRLIVAPPGWVLFCADAKQAELRWVAHESQDPTMLKIFREGGDIHIATAIDLCGGLVKWNRLSKEKQKKYRQAAKAINFGLIYGAYPNTLMQTAKDDYEYDMTYEQAVAWRELYFQTYYRLQEWHRRCILFTRKYGYTKTVFGRRRYLPAILSDNEFLRGEAEREAINTRIQGVSSDSCLLADYTLFRQGVLGEKQRHRIKLCGFTHDESIFQVKEDYLPIVAPKILESMRNLPTKEFFGFDLSVPMDADATYGPHLADQTEWEE